MSIKKMCISKNELEFIEKMYMSKDEFKIIEMLNSNNKLQLTNNELQLMIKNYNLFRLNIHVSNDEVNSKMGKSFDLYDLYIYNDDTYFLPYCKYKKYCNHK